MKTAMREIIEYLQEILDDDFDSKIKYVQENCEKALEKEKQQIIDAIIETSMHGENMAREQAEGYYKENFKL